MRQVLDPHDRWIGRAGLVPGGGGAPFTPAADAALVAWYDAADAATITTSGGAVSALADKAGAADLSQASGAQKPVTGARSLNGLNVIDFDGGDYLAATLALPASGDVAFHMALVIDATANLYEAVLSADAANDFQIDANNAAQFDGRLNATGIGTTTALTGGPFSGALTLSAVFDRTGAGEARVFIAGVSRGTMAYSTAIDPVVGLAVMTNRSRNAWVDGALAETIVTGDVSNRAAYHAYLSGKWGIS